MMKKFLRFLGLFFLLVGIGIQFFQPSKNNGPITEDHLFNAESVPPEVAAIIKGSCLDCHSNTTTYLWYHEMAPVSWLVDEHIREGKKELNFSEWGKIDFYKKVTLLEQICQEADRKTMPLKSYTYLHPSAKLTDKETTILCRWTEQLAEELMRREQGETDNY